MKRTLFVIAGLAAMGVTPAFAGEALDKCVTYVTGAGVADGEAGCACFAEGLEADAALHEEYIAIDIDAWDETASDGLKALAETCFPNA